MLWCSMNKIRLRNLHCLKDTGDIDLLPVTLLVGKNSSGKSSFARAFPLIRQSVERKTNAPVLWYGSNGLVDFGSFKDAVFSDSHDLDDERTVDFCFSGVVGPQSRIEKARWPIYKGGSNYSLELKVKGVGETSCLNSISFVVDGKRFDLECEETGILSQVILDDREFPVVSNNVYWVDTRNFFPETMGFKFYEKADGSKGFSEVDSSHIFQKHLYAALRDNCHGLVKPETIRRIMRRLKAGAAEDIMRQLASFQDTPYSLLESLKRKESALEYISSVSYLVNLSRIISAVSESLTRMYEGVAYIMPLRAYASRYYRRQELSVDEIDPAGENLAMFLDSLRPNEAESFNSWLFDSIGIRVRSRGYSGHVAIEASEGDVYRNISDMGFGLSQILPVAAQLWDATRSRLSIDSSITKSFVVIEQPELHLHPQYQAALANLIVALRNNENSHWPSLIIETHSPHLINRLGKLVYQEKIEKDEVQVLVFSKDDEGAAFVEKAKFDDEGALINWPVGFFDVY